jgi:hypothetical protein
MRSSKQSEEAAVPVRLLLARLQGKEIRGEIWGRGGHLNGDAPADETLLAIRHAERAYYVAGTLRVPSAALNS